MIKGASAKVALVTGGSSGIGAAIALRLAAEGITVIVADVAATPGKSHENIFHRKCDVTNGSDVDNLYRWMTQEVGEPSILIVNAGRGIHERLLEGDPEKWQQVINVNVMGALRIIRSFVPLMAGNGSGDVVFISSVSSGKPYEYGGVYSATKTALDVIAETLRLETLPHIRVASIQAGSVATNFFRSAGHTAPDDAAQLQPEDIAEDVWYLLSKPRHSAINNIITRPESQAF